MTSATTTVDVAIVGFGPTGATLANLLALTGLTVVVIEREAEMYHLPRAVHFDGETMRVFQTVGIADDLFAKVHINPGMKFVDPSGALLLDWPRPQEIGPQGWHASFRLHQPDLETLLRAKLADRPGVEVQTATKVQSVQEDAGGVALDCTVADGTRSTVRARYAVGCDGARSTIRQAMGANLDDLGFEERWLVVDVLLKRERPDLGDHSLQFCDPHRPMTYCRSPANRRRWEITVLDGETDAEVTAAPRIWEFLAPWITPDDADLERSAVYTFRSAVAERWRRGRVLIAGDAAHLTPPFMGQGMCAGIRDASNLAWKLTLCAKGLADEALLDSYQAERDPNVRAYIETAMRLGGLINTMGKDTALARAERGSTGNAKMSSIAPPLGPSTLGGLNSPNDPHVGHLFPQPLLRDGSRLDDGVGYAPALLLRKPSALLQPPIMTTFDAAAHPDLAPALDSFNAEAVLIRPDRHIAAVATTEADVARLARMAFPSSLLAAP